MSSDGEFAIISRIARILGVPSARVELGIGDDAAILSPPRGKLLATVDRMVSGVHFSLSYTGPRELGHKALAINLSDIAAMAGTPRYALVSLSFGAGDEPLIEPFYEGMKALAARHDVDIVGGNLSRGEALVVDVTVLGECEGTPARRDGASPGDLVVLTGPLGASAAGLACLRRWGREAVTTHAEVTRAHLLPEPRLSAARVLSATGGLTALIDVSDGLAADLHHIASQSRVGLRIEQRKIPVTRATREAARVLGLDPLAWALGGGEDYELVATLSVGVTPPRGMTVIGRVTPAGEGVRMLGADGKEVPLLPHGWDHFRSRLS